MLGWYLLYCKPKSELRAQLNLEQQQIATYIPMLVKRGKRAGQQSIEQVPLFPNYIFAKFDPTVTSVSTIRATRGVVQIVDCREKMTPLCALVRALQTQDSMRLSLLQDEADLNTLVEGGEIQHFSEGDMVQIEDGPLKGVRGVFEQASGSKRCNILLEILGRMQSTTVPLELLKRETSLDDSL